MNIDKYSELTGVTVDESDEALIKAQIRRTKSILENMLGYSLNKKKASENQYEEAGKTISDFDDILSDLAPADDVVGSYRLFSYNEKDIYLPVDPYTEIHVAKLVVSKPGAKPNGVTVQTFSATESLEYVENGIKKYLLNNDHCHRIFACYCSHYNVQLAVDADWLNEDCLPEDLMYVWADMVTYYSDEKKDIKSETLATHSYTKQTLGRPEELSESLKIIQKYAGPNGSVKTVVTV